MKPHKHSKLIKQWSDGATIEFLSLTNTWELSGRNPNWREDEEYRVVPEVVYYYRYEREANGCIDISRYMTDEYAEEQGYISNGYRKILSSKRVW